MAKAKIKKTKRTVSKNKAALAGLGIVLVCVGIMLFALQANDAVAPTVSKDLPSEEESTPKTLGPRQGCQLVGTNYLCDIKITNPKEEVLEWSSIITGLDGAKIAEGDSGSVAPNGSTIVKLRVPKEVCDANPEAEGTVVILEDKHSSNQGETTFSCGPQSESEAQQ